MLNCSYEVCSEVVPRHTTEAFLRCIENAFVHFGGVPKTLVIDNLKAAITSADWYDADLNPRVAAFAEHSGTVIPPARAHAASQMGIERGVAYAQCNASPKLSASSIELAMRRWSRRITQAPPEFLGPTVWARWDGPTMQLFDENLWQIAIHVQREPRRFATDAKHILPEKRTGIEHGAAGPRYLLSRVTSFQLSVRKGTVGRSALL